MAKRARIQIGTPADSGDLGSGASVNFNHTMENQSARCVIVMCFGRDDNGSDPVSTATYAGQAMTVVFSAYSGGVTGVGMSMFLLLNPPVGVNAVAITHAGSAQNNRAFACGFWNVDQTTPQDVTATNAVSSGTGAGASLTITPTTDRCMVVSAMGVQANACTQNGQLTSLVTGTATATGTVAGDLSAKEIDPAALTTSSNSETGRFSIAMVALRPRRRKIRTS